MAACGGNIPEQGRPPEVDGDGRKYGRERKSVELVEAASPKLAETCKETLKKVFFPKRMIPGVEARNAPKNAMNVSINNNINNNNNNGEIVTVSGRVEVEGRKGRNSFHQDVEEALNSLLWQPYEYQNKQKLSDGSLGSSSSCSSLSSSGLESSNNGTERNGNAAPDLHLLVNNLHVNRLSQSLASRDAAEQHSGTQLESVLSTIECGTAAASRRAPLHTQLGRRGPCSSSSPSSCPSASSPSDDTSGAAAMRVEIPPQQQQLNHHALQQNQQIGNGNINLMHYGGTSTMIHLQQRTNNNNNVHQLQMQQQQIQVRGAQNNLSSVNVVGLPSHPRQASVPSSAMTSNRNNLLMPTHSRNISEPFRTSSNNNSNSNVFLQGHHPRNGSEPVATPYRPPTTINNANIVSILNHQRYTTNVNTAAVNHMRSSSMPYQNVNGGGGAAVVHQRNGSDLNATRSGRVPLNVSNVNVNYYRAVPVNVVSAVPTIHCYNNHTTSDSNNVSNVNIVQAMPVNQQTLPVPTSYAPPPPTLATNTTSTCTEVIVHSSQEPVVPEVRTFTSTEAQTDDTVVNEAAAREQRRRERRERRHHRRVYNHRHNNNVSSSSGGTADNSTQFNGTQTDRLPDLLNNTLPPPYSTMPSNGSQMMAPPPLPPPNILVPHGTIVQTMVPNSIVPNGLVPNAMVPFHHPQVVPGQVPLVQGAGPVPVPVPSPTGFRFPFPAGGFR
ncbi:PREDICTED: putative uncharacterized protein DDB_G0277255, partial [Nicrophorus vespilloides]|uniref:Uncharacterized protein n=1 Tax=Nicrophorus vespilloides TaxID=110193 RepID=A0ABM1M7P3_NICVS